MKFTKMHGLGNDYIYVDGSAEDVPDPARLAVALSDRHRGIGSDGLIIIRPPAVPEAAGRMEMYNADGSRAGMCGNGIRCVAKWLLDRGRAPGPGLAIETDTGLKRLRAVGRGPGGLAERIEVDMGEPRLRRSEVPFIDGPPESRAVRVPIRAAGRIIEATCVSMGNPHCVITISGKDPFGRTLHDLDLASIGPAFERHPSFPERTNVEFIEVRSRTEIDFRVWERGSGETQACGTGACAAVAAAVLEGVCDRGVKVHLLGGDLDVRWDEATGSVFMTGPAVEVFTGDIAIPLKKRNTDFTD
jgi:diaminopimelate epimerase